MATIIESITLLVGLAGLLMGVIIIFFWPLIESKVTNKRIIFSYVCPKGAPRFLQVKRQLGTLIMHPGDRVEFSLYRDGDAHGKFTFVDFDMDYD